ncbi:hypothetical protein A6S26_12015 [Nostoc sp. ATCC 43529]|nr:hypothetical protein A6S26_12015 [Nostoc sp. ATCC 43529]
MFQTGDEHPWTTFTFKVMLTIVAVGQYFHYRPGQKFRHHQQLQDLALFHHFGERKISTNELKY